MFDIPDLSCSERDKLIILHNCAQYLGANIAKANSAVGDIYQRSKINHNEKSTKEYGYYISNIIPIIPIIDYFRIKSLFDLGCGAGIMLLFLQIYKGGDFKVGGVDNEDSLIKIANMLNIPAFKKDVIEVTAKEISDFYALYIWEPIINTEKNTKFAKHLEIVMKPKQFLIYKCAGNLVDSLVKRKSLHLIAQKNGIYVFQKS